ncbi:MAG: serine hydrolase domain-containing protein [Acidimicrobiia bacterium]
MGEIEGLVPERFTKVADALARSIDDGADVGGSVAIAIDGELVADFWGGFVDEARTRPWERDTIVNVWSTTKTMSALTALVLADRGLLDLDAPVATYWPEFAANGKDGVLVKHVLSHTSGVSGWAQPVTQDDVYDLDRSAEILAAQAPWWEPGTASGYHAINQGHLIGELVRRTTGRTLGTYFGDEIAGPLGADFHIGLAPEHDARVSPVIPPPPLQLDLAGDIDMESPAMRTFTGPPVDANHANTEAWRRAEIGAANGHGNARSVARIQSVVSNGGSVDGVALLSTGTIDRIFEVQADGVDLVLGIPLRFGIGYGLPVAETIPYLPSGDRICFWGGWGGSVVINDLDRRMTFAFMMNRMAEGIIGGATAAALLTEAYAAL